MPAHHNPTFTRFWKIRIKIHHFDATPSTSHSARRDTRVCRASSATWARDVAAAQRLVRRHGDIPGLLDYRICCVATISKTCARDRPTAMSPAVSEGGAPSDLLTSPLTSADSRSRVSWTLLYHVYPQKSRAAALATQAATTKSRVRAKHLCCAACCF